MSHTVRGQSQMTDAELIRRACQSMGINPPTHETVRFFDGRTATGTAVRLPEWRYPVVIAEDGSLTMDDYGGSWGPPRQLTELRQQYALAAVQAEYGDTHRILTSRLDDGSLLVEVGG